MRHCDTETSVGLRTPFQYLQEYMSTWLFEVVHAIRFERLRKHQESHVLYSGMDSIIYITKFTEAHMLMRECSPSWGQNLYIVNCECLGVLVGFAIATSRLPLVPALFQASDPETHV